MLFEEEEGETTTGYNLWTVDSNGLTRYKYFANLPDGRWGQCIYDPPANYLPAEVSISTEKPFNFTIHMTDSTGLSEMVQFSGETSVVALEDVTVPAGTFTDCLKIEITQTLISSTIPEITYAAKITVWLAKGVGEVKTIDIHNDGTGGETIELLSATVGGISYP